MPSVSPGTILGRVLSQILSLTLSIWYYYFLLRANWHSKILSNFSEFISCSLGAVGSGKMIVAYDCYVFRFLIFKIVIPRIFLRDLISR